jgi:hypothetical protein
MKVSKTKARATIKHFDDGGRQTRPSVRTYATLCAGERPEVFEIPIPDSRTKRFTSIYITRAEIERVLNATPRGSRREAR